MSFTRSVISGFHNYGEAEQVHFARLRKATEVTFSRFGFVPFTPRPVETIQDLQVGGVGHQVYQLARMEDGGITDLGLPYDRTIQLATWVATHAHEILFPYKRQDISPSFRGEHPQLGRLRAFYQADIDLIGPSLGSTADAECLATVISALTSMGIGDFVIKLNHMGILKAIIKHEWGIDGDLLKKALQKIDKLAKQSPEEVAKEIVSLSGTLDYSRVLQLLTSLSQIKTLEEIEANSDWRECTNGAIEEMKRILEQLPHFDVDTRKIKLSLSLARGLDYYTGMVFETEWVGQEQIGSIASGGRYDNLVTGFSAPNARALQGVGGSIGLTRIFEVFRQFFPETIKRKSDADVIVCFHKDEEFQRAAWIATTLRKGGKKVDLYPQGTAVNLGDKLDHANRKGIPYAILVFEKDVILREMNQSTQKNFDDPQVAVNFFLTGEQLTQEVVEV